MPPLDETAFYGLVLSGSGGRAVVRDWIDTTVGRPRRASAAGSSGSVSSARPARSTRPLGLYALAAATVREPRRDLGPVLPRALLHAALTGGPLPSDVLYQAVRRNRAEQAVIGRAPP